MDINENVEIVKSPDEIYCSSCGKPIKKEAEICPHCGVRNKNSLSSSKINDGMSTFERLHIVSEEIEKLGIFYKLGFYIQGLALLLALSIYTLLIAPIVIYFWGGSGWPKNSLVKAVLYYFAYTIPIIVIIVILVPIVVILSAVIAAFVFGMGPPT